MMRLHGVKAEVPGGEDAEAGVETRVDEAPIVQPVVGHHWATGIGYNKTYNCFTMIYNHEKVKYSHNQMLERIVSY